MLKLSILLSLISFNSYAGVEAFTFDRCEVKGTNSTVDLKQDSIMDADGNEIFYIDIKEYKFIGAMDFTLSTYDRTVRYKDEHNRTVYVDPNSFEIFVVFNGATLINCKEITTFRSTEGK